ncbi:MAG: hypothetical protein WCT04_06505 [Planctomycetota bacterium]
MSKCFLSIVAFVCVSSILAADRVTMISGSDIEGQVVRDTPGDPLVAINTGGKLTLLNRSDISAITLDDDGRADYAKRLNAIKKINAAAAHFELYTWALSQRFFDYAERELAATLASDPRHAEARKIALNPPPFPAAVSPKTEVVAGVQELAVIRPRDAVADAGPVIGIRPSADRVRAEFDDKIMIYCKALMSASSADESARKTAATALALDRVKATETVFAQLDPARNADEQTRLAALAGIDVLKPATPEVSKRLAQVAIADRFIPVRKQAVALIKSRNDEGAMNAMVNAFIGAFGDNGQVRDPIMQAAAGEALKGLDDKRVLTSIQYRATTEIRTAVTDLNALTTRQIDSYTVNSGAQATVIVPLSFPIQFPELNITSVKTTVCAPCAALSSLTGQNFGNDLDQWAKWIRMQK